jgi:hypothetical protein
MLDIANSAAWQALEIDEQLNTPREHASDTPAKQAALLQRRRAMFLLASCKQRRGEVVSRVFRLLGNHFMLI